MASKFALVLVLVLTVTTGRVPGRLELKNPDLELATGAARLAAKRGWTLPNG